MDWRIIIIIIFLAVLVVVFHGAANFMRDEFDGINKVLEEREKQRKARDKQR